MKDDSSESVIAVDPHRDVTGALHDVSNALTVILGWVGEARGEGSSLESIHYALQIVEERARAARALARRAIGAGVDLDRDDALQSILDGVLQALKPEAHRTNVQMIVSGEATSRVPRSDDLSQIVTNLVLNAIAFSPRGGNVHIRAKSGDPFSTIEIEDEGAGVPESRRKTIFRGSSTREGGAGIGLRHARALARAAGGNLELLIPRSPSAPPSAPSSLPPSSHGSSMPPPMPPMPPSSRTGIPVAAPSVPELNAKKKGPGAHFRITWPRVNYVPTAPVSVPRKPLLEGRRILLVEDDSDVVQLLESALGARGAEVTVVRTLPELLAAATQDHDAALIDLSPIASDVPAAFSALKNRIPPGHLIVITGSADALPAAVTAEDIRLVRKPFEVGEIVAALLERPSGFG